MGWPTTYVGDVSIGKVNNEHDRQISDYSRIIYTIRGLINRIGSGIHSDDDPGTCSFHFGSQGQHFHSVCG